MYKTLVGPLVAQVEICADCTNFCSHCYNYWRKSKELVCARNFPAEKIGRLIEQLLAVGVFNVVFTGGEPLLNKKVLFQLMEQAKDVGIVAGINSNLVPLTLKDAEKLKQLNATGVLTSILGPTAKQHDAIAGRNGMFKRTVRGIKFLQEAGVPVMVNMVVSQKNKHLLRETILFVKSLGVKSFNSTRAGCPGNCSDFSEFSLSLQELRDSLAELYDIGQKEGITVGVLESYPLCAIKEVDKYKAFTGRHCFAGVTTLTVATNGEVRPCSHLDISYGNIFQEDLREIWARMYQWRDGSLLPSVCHSCKIFAKCGGGCRMEAKMRNGSFTDIDPYIIPEDVDYVASRLARRNDGVSIKPLPLRFKLNPNARWRKEDFGAIVFVGSRLACYLNAVAVKLLKSLDSGHAYQLSDFVNKFNGDPESFLTQLYNRQVIISI